MVAPFSHVTKWSPPRLRLGRQSSPGVARKEVEAARLYLDVIMATETVLLH